MIWHQGHYLGHDIKLYNIPKIKWCADIYDDAIFKKKAKQHIQAIPLFQNQNADE